MTDKIILYQIFTRLFGNKTTANIPGGTLQQNGSGKMNFIDRAILQRIKAMGVTHVWYTGVIRHATCTNYSSYNIPRQNPAVVKGKAGSPYAITDYYDIDPDLAEDVPSRMAEFEALIKRTHRAGMKVIIDFVPNHVARQYQSVTKPEGVKDFGADDDTNKHFSPNNNFYYCPGQPFTPKFNINIAETGPYTECPAKATGNDHFDASPSITDWYETIKLNYGIDYCDAGGRSEHFSPVPNTWEKMTAILLFWAAKGVDGFRCDMAEMVPPAFWQYAISKLKNEYPEICIIGEVYNPSLYRTYLQAGFDYLYDKVGMYDTVRAVMRGQTSTQAITHAWQQTDDIHTHMLYFLEDHDEQRIASHFFAGKAEKGIPATIATALMRTNPVMLYAGQEYGEEGMDSEGFSGKDGRTTIFDYWCVPSLYHAYVDRRKLTAEEKHLHTAYQAIMQIAAKEKAVAEGEFFDLMYVNQHLHDVYAYLRKAGNELLLVAANFSEREHMALLNIPAHAMRYLNIPAASYRALDLLTGENIATTFTSADNALTLNLPAMGGRVYKINVETDKMEKNEQVVNEHMKEEFPPAHTAEHLLNQTMGRIFGCPRSTNAHIERKKSKMTFVLDHKPSRKEEKEIETRMNELISQDLPVTYEMVSRDHLPEGIDASRLPDDATHQVRLVRIGDYDVCPCIGKHVRSTAQIGRFVLLGTNWDELTHSFRVRFKII